LNALNTDSTLSLTATLAEKSWLDAGVCTPYTFNVKNAGTGTLAAGYWVIVEFSS